MKASAARSVWCTAGIRAGMEMRRKFNTTGSCRPDKHYMVRLDDRIKAIKEQYVEFRE